MTETRPIDEERARAAAERLGFDWHYRDETGSTNADALEHYQRHRRQVVAVGEAQLAGRGRRGNAWHSPRARNIYCTVGIHKQIAPECQGLLSIVTGLALRRALERETGVRAALKWPNDILCDGRKLGGILIESRALGDGGFFFAVGFGINVFMRADELRAIPQPAISLREAGAGALDRGALLIAAIEAVIGDIREFDAAAVPALIDEFRRADAFHGEPVEVLVGGERIAGTNLGIGADGQLRLQTADGIQLHAAAEISLRGGTR